MMTEVEKKALEWLKTNSYFETKKVGSRTEITRKEPSSKQTYIMVSTEFQEEIDRLNKIILDKQKTIDILFTSIHNLEIQNAELKNELEILKLYNQEKIIY